MTTTFTPGPNPNTVRAADGKILTVPEGWILLPPGDAALTRRVKAAGDHWVVAEKRGRKTFSRGICASMATIQRVRADLEAERSTEGFAKKKEADAERRYRPSTLTTSWGRSWRSCASMRITPILPTAWLVP